MIYKKSKDISTATADVDAFNRQQPALYCRRVRIYCVPQMPASLSLAYSFIALSLHIPEFVNGGNGYTECKAL